MSSAPPSDAICLFPKKNRWFHVDVWEAMLKTDYDLSAATTITKVTHCKSTKDVAHEFVIVEMEVQLQSFRRPVYMVTDRGPTKNHGRSSSFPLLSIPPTSSPHPSSGGSMIRTVSADDCVWVPYKGLKKAFDSLVLKKMGGSNVVSELYWPSNEISLPAMSVMQLAVLLRTIHDHRDQYAANSHSCYWYAFTVMEVIRLKFGAHEEKGPAFGDRSRFLGKKMDVDDDTNAVSTLYDVRWADWMKKVKKREV